MDKQTLSLFPEEGTPKKVFEFLIVINFPESINEYVKNLKTEFYKEFGSFPSRGSKPHITISKFPLSEEEPGSLITYLQRSFQNIAPFIVVVNGFKSFEKVIYLNVEEADGLDELKEPFKVLREEFRPKKYFFIFRNPHITIARGLHPDIFEKAEPDYLSRMYVNTLVVDKLRVLRRENFGNGKYSKYDHIADLILGG